MKLYKAYFNTFKTTYAGSDVFIAYSSGIPNTLFVKKKLIRILYLKPLGRISSLS